MPRSSLLVAAIALTLAGSECKRPATPQSAEPPKVRASTDPNGVLEVGGLVLSTETQTDGRVKKAFPQGVATEDARKQIGAVPAAPKSSGVDGKSVYVVTVTLPKPMALHGVKEPLAWIRANDSVRAHVANSDEDIGYADERDDDPTVDRLAVVASVASDGVAVARPALEQTLKTARRIAGSLALPPPVESMSIAAALGLSKRASAARKAFPDEKIESGVMIAAPDGMPFPGRLMWDAVYSAGFVWGDGDYFHWLPSPDADPTAGISIGTSTGTGYFLPESLAQPGGGAVESLELSFSVALAWKPVAMYDAMMRAASYLAKRLGGRVVDLEGNAYDATKERARVLAIERRLLGYGVVPGSALAQGMF